MGLQRHVLLNIILGAMSIAPQRGGRGDFDLGISYHSGLFYLAVFLQRGSNDTYTLLFYGGRCLRISPGLDFTKRVCCRCGDSPAGMTAITMVSIVLTNFDKIFVEQGAPVEAIWLLYGGRFGGKRHRHIHLPLFCGFFSKTFANRWPWDEAKI